MWAAERGTKMAQLYSAVGSPEDLHDHSDLQLIAPWKRKTSANFSLIQRGLVFLWLITFLHIGSAYKQDGCVFPPRWNGRWFQSGVQQQIVIEGDRLSSKGKCLSSEGDKFIIFDEKKCYRCVVIHEKHINVLQYKESFCLSREALPSLCSLINGDALLFSMFRESANPVNCPLRGPFSFTYNRGHGECKSPVSSIESCTEESRLLLNYQACPDVHGSESTVEELECLATWKEGSLRYLVGKVHHNHATSNEDRYRCFVYEKTNGIGTHSLVKEGDGVEYRVAQSGDATCNGLFSASEGSRTMALKRVPLSWKCRFPPWMTFPGHWHTLDYSSTYSFHQKNATLRITNQTGADIKVHCAHIKTSPHNDNSVLLIAHWQHHCVGQFVCLAFYRRGMHAAEMQVGQPTGRAEDACSPIYFNASTAPFITLVTSNPESRECPYSGKFAIAGLKIHQRNARSLEPTYISNDTEKSYHKHHRKYKYFESADDKLTNAERKKKKYQKFLEKIFAKEVIKRDSKRKRISSILNGTRLLHNNSSSHDNLTIDNINVSNELSRYRRSSGNADQKACINNEFTMLDIGCNTVENMEFHSSCDSKEIITAYLCHGGWTENGTSFLITTPLTRDSIGAKRFCFIYKESQDRMIHFTRSSVSCDRSIRPGIDGALVFNATNSGGCLETSLGVTINRSKWRILLIDCLFIYLVLFISHSIIMR